MINSIIKAGCMCLVLLTVMGSFSSVLGNGGNAANEISPNMKSLIDKAAGGDAVSQFRLAEEYLEGLRIGKDYIKSEALFAKAAEQGYVARSPRISMMYNNDESVEHNYIKVRKLRESKSIPAPHEMLSRLYKHYRDDEKDYERVRKFMVLAAELGYAGSQFDLGMAYYEGNEIEQDHAKASEWFTMAANQGHVVAQYYIGMMYDEGIGVGQDHKKAVKWFTKLADHGDVSAMIRLAWLYANGEGVERDYKQAIKLYSRAAMLGEVSAQSKLAWMYENGMGTHQDFIDANEWKLIHIKERKGGDLFSFTDIRGRKRDISRGAYGRSFSDCILEEGRVVRSIVTNGNRVKTYEKIYDDEKTISEISWYRSGQKREEKLYDNGKAISEKSWYFSGEKEREKLCDDGKTISDLGWHKGGQKEREVVYDKDGIRRRSFEWYPSGQMSLACGYDEEGKGFLVKKWYKDGTKKYEARFKNGKMDLESHYNEDGTLHHSKKY